MGERLKLVKIKEKYCEYLRKHDSKVAYNSNNKNVRPFVGVLFKINGIEYFAPLSSPKEKHLKMKNTIDFIKIADGKLGAINLNNMLPVNKENYSLAKLECLNENTEEKKYIMLLIDQLFWLNENHIQVRNKAKNLYELYKRKKIPANIEKRCCNYSLLEEKLREYEF